MTTQYPKVTKRYVDKFYRSNGRLILEKGTSVYIFNKEGDYHYEEEYFERDRVFITYIAAIKKELKHFKDNIDNLIKMGYRDQHDIQTDTYIKIYHDKGELILYRPGFILTFTRINDDSYKYDEDGFGDEVEKETKKLKILEDDVKEAIANGYKVLDN